MATGGSPIIALLASIAEKDIDMDKLFETNWNVSVMVRLTADGKKVYREHHSAANEWIRSNFPDREHLHLDPDDELKEMEEKHHGWCLFQLWNLMKIFGPHIKHGMPRALFEAGIVRFVE